VLIHRPHRADWEGPGRAEPVRLAFKVASMPFEDCILTGESWEGIKPTTPWGQVPVLEVDGKPLAQSRAILNYVGRQTGLYPSDPFEGAKVEEFCDTVEECVSAVLAASYGQSGEAKLEARQRVAAPGSKLHEWLGKLDAALGRSRSGYAVGSQLTIADLRIFCELSAMVSGWYDGLPRTLLGRYASIQKHRAMVAKLPKVEQVYASATGPRLAFKPFDPGAMELLAPEPCTKLVSSYQLLRTDTPIPTELRQVSASAATQLTLHKSTYPANAPSEDRSTLVVGDGFIFTGVWDGHGGVQASNYSETEIYNCFKQHFDLNGGGVEEAFQHAYTTVDADYLADAKARNDPKSLFAGTCAVGVFIDYSQNLVCCSNLGDSRAVVGLYAEGDLQVVNMSEDHTAVNPGEIARIKAEHPNDPTALVQMSEDDDDWRVKGICAFSRSIGDTQMKDKAAATIYNSFTRGYKVMPRPGVKAKGEPERTKPYISAAPEYRTQRVDDGFCIIACDGVWDEMSSDAAVAIVADLIAKHKGPGVNIADLFIEEVLKCAVHRITETIEEEEGLTLAELKARPQGKAELSDRSCLHDDITCVIVQFDTDTAMSAAVSSKITLSADHSSPAAMARELFGKMDLNGDGLLDRAEISALATRLGKTLTAAQLDEAMAEMDADRSGEVDATEFEQWWASVGVKLMRKGTTSKTRAAAEGGALGAVLSEVIVTGDDETRRRTTEQMLRLSKTMEGMSTAQLKMLFDALDVDHNGTLDRGEITKLVTNVLQETAVNDAVMDSCFEEMDADSSGTVEWDEFANFFDLAQTSV
jgi:glutathione S-transferase